MKKILSILMLIGSVVGFCLMTASCNSHKPLIVQLPPDTITKTTTIKEIVRDTIFKVSADSSKLQAQLTIDSIGNIILTEVKTNSGNYVKPPNVKIKDNILTIDCEAKAQELFFQWKENYIKEHTEKTQAYVPNGIIPNNNKETGISWWETALMFLGVIFLILLFISFGQFIFKYFKQK